MVTTTDGREIVYGLFNADGCECEDFLGAFGSEESAETVRRELETLIMRFYTKCLESEWRGSVTVRPVTLGEYHTPADAAHMLEKA